MTKKNPFDASVDDFAHEVDVRFHEDSEAKRRCESQAESGGEMAQRPCSTRFDMLNKLAVLLFQKTGLSRCVSSIYNEIEEEISGRFTRLNDEDDEGSRSVPYYGGVCYCSHSLVDVGKFSYQLNNELNEVEKALLLRIVEDKSLNISVERTDFEGQQWSFDLLIPYVLNQHDSETFDLSCSVTVSAYRQIYDITAQSSSGLSENQIAMTLAMYSLQL